MHDARVMLAVTAMLSGLTLCVAVGAHAAPVPAEVYDPDPVPGVVEQFAVLTDRVHHTDPDLAVTSRGEVWTVFLTYDGKQERVQAARIDASADGTERVSRVDISTAPGTYFRPRIATDDRGFAYVVWGALMDGHYDILLRTYDGYQWGDIENVTQSDARDAEPALAASDAGHVWVVWESTANGSTDIFARMRRPTGPWEPAVRVTHNPATDATPTVAVSRKGEAWAAWMSWRDGRYQNGNYNIYARRIDQSIVGPPKRISVSKYVDCLPELIRLNDELALVWTEAYFAKRDTGPITAIAYDRWCDATYRIARLDRGFWDRTQTVRMTYNDQRPPYVLDIVSPIAGRDPTSGEVWLFHGFMLSQRSEWWTSRLVAARPRQVSEPLDISGNLRNGGRRVGLAWHDGYLWMAQTNEWKRSIRPGAKKEGKIMHASWIEVRKIDPGKLPDFKVAERKEPKPRMHPKRDMLGYDLPRNPRSRADIAGQPNFAYFGNLHLHTDISRDFRHTEGPPAQNYRVLYDLAKLDFAGYADHGGNINVAEWRHLMKINNLWNRPGDFVTLHGFEWTSSPYGHKNVYFPDDLTAQLIGPIVARRAEPTKLWERLKGFRALAIPHHPSHGVSRPTDWSYHNDDFQRLVEIFQWRSNYEYDGAPLQQQHRRRNPWHNGHSVRDALNQGHKLGIMASPDHGGGLGVAGVWAPELTREAIFNALYNRRCFGTTGVKMTLYLEVAGQPLGSEVKHKGEPVSIHGQVRGTADGLTLTIIRNGEEVYEQKYSGKDAVLDWNDPLLPVGDVYYYLRASQSDGHIGWTSPVWLTPAD